jgi:nitroimidazol reductase NimA-like FMN-containing flavoprotein (pyridoxamine 5'-phosphate oxidase superfamily)
MAEGDLRKTKRSQLKRLHERASYERDRVNEIIDATLMGHFAYVIDGTPHIIPTFQWREGNRVFWHGSSASRFLRQVVGQQVSLAITNLDGFVLARSAFHHSVNYRSVVLYGEAEGVAETDKVEKLRNFLDGVFPGRWETLRPINKQEIKATTVLSMAIDEGSAKVRSGHPIDDDEDYALPIWAGIVPTETTLLEPIADPRNLDGVALPDHVANFKLRGK